MGFPTQEAPVKSTPVRRARPAAVDVAVSVFLLAAFSSNLAPAAAVEPPPSPAVTAFVGVTVVPADRERLLPDQTVIVRGDRIVALGPAARIEVPADASRIDGTGKFLMPGIAEMHGHLPNEADTDDIARLWFQLFVANGVTTVRGVWGAANQFGLRERIARGQLLGPRLVLFSRPISGKEAPTPEQGVELVRKYKKMGYDGLKISEGLTLPTFQAIARTARTLGMPFGGHVPNEVGLQRALAAGQRNIEHLDGYLEAMVKDSVPLGGSPQPDEMLAGIMQGDWPALDHLDQSRIPVLVRATRQARAMVTPTMFVWRTLYGDADPAELARLPELQYIPPNMRERWATMQAEVARKAPPAERLGRLMAVRDRMLKALADAGGLIMLGADSPQRYAVPGFSLRHETAALVKAGMTPWQVVEAATIAPARYLGLTREQGTVAVGKRADLILTDGNPLQDVSNIFRSSGVMVAGHWHPRAQLDQMLASIARNLHFPSRAEVKDLPIPAATGNSLAGRYKFDRGDATMVVSYEKGALLAAPSAQTDKKMRLRSQGDGVYLVPEDHARVTFEMKEGRAAAMIVDVDAARLRGARLMQ
jgi:hypothetical protein